MKFFKHLILTSIILLTLACTKQKANKEESIKVEKATVLTTLKPNDTLNVDPYHFGDLSEHYDTNTIDFSEEFLKTNTKQASTYGKLVDEKIQNYTFDVENIFKGKQNGAIGFNYRRIIITINEAHQNKNMPLTFDIKGFSSVSGNKCDFIGKITFISAFEIEKNYDYKGQAVLLCRYKFLENKHQKYSGVFKGTFESSITINHSTKTVEFDDSFRIADGYANRTYVGAWKSYKSDLEKKCIWGDNRLPYTFDLDIGVGEMFISDKYIENGWEDFNR